MLKENKNFRTTGLPTEYTIQQLIKIAFHIFHTRDSPTVKKTLIKKLTFYFIFKKKIGPTVHMLAQNNKKYKRNIKESERERKKK